MGKKCTIPMQACQSSMFKEYGYDEASKTLAVRFSSSKKPTVYTYGNVTPELYADMRAAPSAGKFFGEHIRGKDDFPVTVIDESEEVEEQAS